MILEHVFCTKYKRTNIDESCYLQCDSSIDRNPSARVLVHFPTAICARERSAHYCTRTAEGEGMLCKNSGNRIDAMVLGDLWGNEVATNRLGK